MGFSRSASTTVIHLCRKPQHQHIMEITKDLLRALRVDVDAALAPIGKKHGVVLKLGRGTFSALNATFKLEVDSIGDGGEVVTKELANLREMHRILGLEEAHLSQVFAMGGKNFTLAGYKNTGGAKPFLIRDVSDDKLYVSTREALFRALKIAGTEKRPGTPPT